MVAKFTIDGIAALAALDRLARELKVSRGTIVRAYDYANRDEATARPVRVESRGGRPTNGARNPGLQNASRGVRDCIWSLWRPQQRARQAS
jgi:DNA-binding transcriptional MocR family regulator